MDSFKREIYMEVLKHFEHVANDDDYFWMVNDDFICTNIQGYAQRTWQCSISMHEFDQFFPELRQLFDNKCWVKPKQKGCYNYFPRNVENSWWSCDWPEPRIRLLQFLLSDHHGVA